MPAAVFLNTHVQIVVEITLKAGVPLSKWIFLIFIKSWSTLVDRKIHFLGCGSIYSNM